MLNLILSKTLIWKDFDIAYGVGIFGLIFIILVLTFYISNKALKKFRDAETSTTLFTYGLSVVGSYFGMWIVLGTPGLASAGGDAGFANYIALYAGILAALLIFVPIFGKILKIADRYRVNSLYLFLVKRYSGSKALNTIFTAFGFLVVLPIVAYPIHVVADFIRIFSGDSIGIIMSYFIMLVFIFFFVNKLNPKNLRSTTSFNFMLAFVIGFILFIISLFTGEQSQMTMNIVKPNGSIFISLFILGLITMFTLPRQFNIIRADLKTNKYTYLKVIIVCFAIFIPLFHLISPYAGWGGYLYNIKTGNDFTLKAFAIFALVLGAALSTIGPQLNAFTRIVHEGIMSNFFRKTKSALKWSFIASFLFILFSVFLFGLLHGLIVDAYKLQIPAHYMQIKSTYVLSKLFFSSMIFLGSFFIILIGGLYWRRGNKFGALMGFTLGFIVWILVELLPQFTGVSVLSKIIKMDYGQGWYTLTAMACIYLTTLFFYVLVSLITPKDSESLVAGYVNIDDAGVDFFISEDIQSFMTDTAKTPLRMEIIAYFKDNFTNQYTLRDLLVRLFWKGEFHEDEVEAALKELAGIELLKEIIRNNVRYYQYNVKDAKLDDIVENFTRSYYTAKQLFYKQAEDEFNRQSEKLRKEKQKLSDEVGLLEIFMEVSETFSKVLETELLYKSVAELATKQLGFDSTEIYLKNKDGSISLKQIFYSNYSHLTQSDDYFDELFQNDEDKQQQLNEILETGEPFIMNDPEKSIGEEKSVYAVYPIKEDGKISAFMEVGYSGRGRRIADKELNRLKIFINTVELTFASVRLFEGLEEKVRQRTAQLNKANEDMKELNSKLEAANIEMKRELKVASQIQQAIVPKELPTQSDFDIGYFWVPMVEVSGDYYDFIDIGEGKYGILIVDVSGHGVPSGLVTTMAKIGFNNHSKPGVTTAEICDMVNREIYSILGDIGFYLTAFYGVFDTNTYELQYTNAGHEPSYWIKKGSNNVDDIVLLESPGFFIGSFDGAEYGYNTVKLSPGDIVVFFTDGIPEARNPKGGFYEEERLKELIISNQNMKAQELADYLYDDVVKFAEGRAANDDRTTLIFSVTGNGPKKAPAKAISEKDEVMKEFIDYWNKGAGLVKEAKYEKAIEAFKQALKISPNNIKVMINLGHIYRKQKNYDLALEHYLHALEHNDNNSEVHNALGVVYYYKKDLQNAKIHFEKALDLKPDLNSAKVNIEKINKLLEK